MYADAHGLPRQGRRAADPLADRRGGLRRLAGVQPRAARSTTPACPTTSCAARPASPWPVNDEAPDGTDRLYTDPVFPTDTDQCETYGHDLLTGAAVTEQEHRAMAPGRPRLPQRLRRTHPPHEQPSEDYPLLYTTGRTVYQFHTRTKTGRSRSLHDAAPGRLGRAVTRPMPTGYGIAEGDLVARRVTPRRDRGPGPDRPGHGPARCSRRSTTAHWDLDAAGPDEQARQGRQRAHHDRLGPGLQAAVLQDRGLPGHQAPRRHRTGTGADHGGLGPSRTGVACRRPRVACRPAARPSPPRPTRTTRHSAPTRRPRPAPSQGGTDAAPGHLPRPAAPIRADPGRVPPHRRTGPSRPSPTSSTPACRWRS